MNLKQFFLFTPPKGVDEFTLTNTPMPDNTFTEPGTVQAAIADNLNKVKAIYTMPTNFPTIIREFEIKWKDSKVAAFILFIDGMVDKNIINDNILKPLMITSNIKDDLKTELVDYVEKRLITHSAIDSVSEFDEIIQKVNFGNCAIFIDGVAKAIIADVKSWEHRAVGRAVTEEVIHGPHEVFNEVLLNSFALVRRAVKDPNLVVESIILGRRSKTNCALFYIKDITNKQLVDEARRRLNGIDTDFILSSGQLEQFIENKTFVPIPQFMTTERPDRLAISLLEGKIAIMVDGSPNAIIAPVSIFEFISSPEDMYLRFPFANMLRVIRILGLVLSFLLPGLFVSIVNFHKEMIPTDLLFTIVATQEKVPFPLLLEVLIMDLLFELVREAGIRIPNPIGAALSIVGTLILGQSAVSANLVSPIVIIIVALTAIGSLATPNYTLGFSFRYIRFFYTIMGGIAGFLGLIAAFFITNVIFASVKSLGVPIFVPFAPKKGAGLIKKVFASPAWDYENRDAYLHPMNNNKQPKISRKWNKDKE